MGITAHGKRLSKARAERTQPALLQINRHFWPKRKHRIASRKLDRAARPGLP